MPPGAGKTEVAAEIARRALRAGIRCVAYAHRTEIVDQLYQRLPECGVAGTKARVVAATYQYGTNELVARKLGGDGIVIVDECHHLPVDQWWASRVIELYGSNRWLGLTATPQRGDGKPLSGTFDHLIVGANYSELLDAGRIVPCKAYCPPRQIGSGDLAQCPIKAYKKYGNGQQTFVFVSRKEESDRLAADFCAEGIEAASITADTAPGPRQYWVDRFRRGVTRVLVNVYTLTEGVDVPNASCAILCRNFGSASTYLQSVGRVTRSAPGKECATIIDLCGSVLRHGLPTIDREYSLESGIAPSQSAAMAGVSVCKSCGITYAAGPTHCPECGNDNRSQKKKPKIWSLDLAEVYSGSDTDAAAKRAEFIRLRNLAYSRGWSLSWVIREYKKLFEADPPLSIYTTEDKRRECKRLLELQIDKGFKRGYTYARFQKLFGHPMPGDWWGLAK